MLVYENVDSSTRCVHNMLVFGSVLMYSQTEEKKRIKVPEKRRKTIKVKSNQIKEKHKTKRNKTKTENTKQKEHLKCGQ